MSIRATDLYDLTLSKGNLCQHGDTMPVIAWDALTLCPGDNKCKIYDRCPYTKREGTKCRIEVNYMNAVYQAFLPIIEKTDDMMIRIKIGMHIIPLYLQLCRLKKTELALNGETCYQTPKGSIMTHPAYKSINETLRSLEREISGPFLTYIRGLGFQRVPYEGLEGPVLNGALSGDASYYTQMEQAEPKRKKPGPKKKS